MVLKVSSAFINSLKALQTIVFTKYWLWKTFKSSSNWTFEFRILEKNCPSSSSEVKIRQNTRNVEEILPLYFLRQ